tara:strand:- start:418 stop:1299 length:882 start_codon:yes stop_codon:yes gene_type:complete
MKIIDCSMYFDEDMMLDVRLNTLDKYVSHFIICEATYNHNGVQKKLNFDINKFVKFKDKITYLALDDQPDNLRTLSSKDTELKRNSKVLDNALLRENYQRNFVLKHLEKISEEDLIIINDVDEIPNLNGFKYNNKITIFKQKLFYYKFNLLYPDFTWVGSKICKKKHLISPQWLRNIKSRKYPLWRLDALFSKKKYYDVGFVNNGGWHFTNIKNAEAIDFKMRNFLHHLEYEYSGMNTKDIKKNISEKKVIYNYFADSKEEKQNNGGKLEKLDLSELPDYISKNSNKFQEWID